MRVTTRKMLRLQLWILTGVLGCDANTVGLLTGCLPFAIPGLTTDAGAPPVVPITGGSFDAAGFFEDPDGGVAAAGEACGASRGCDTAAGLDCVGVTQEDSVCLQRCGALDACPNGLACEVLSSGRYCLSVVGRGAACEVARCDPTNGLGCLPARAEGAQLLATTCQLPCDVAAPTCPLNESCLPNVAGAVDWVGPCPCGTGETCVPLDGGSWCAVPKNVCGTLAPLSDPALLGEPSAWPVNSTCDPGTSQRMCGGTLDGGARVVCAQSASPAQPASLPGFVPAGVTGLCVAICRDPVTGGQTACPAGWTCNVDLRALFHVPDGTRTCDTVMDCDVARGEVCAGPLPAFGDRRLCALPYGLCQPPAAADAGP
jgi:hypothetical protein